MKTFQFQSREFHLGIFSIELQSRLSKPQLPIVELLDISIPLPSEDYKPVQ